MWKRKRDGEHEPKDEVKVPTSQDLQARRRELEHVLERSKQLLSQALKLARGFERQKLGRRQKAAKVAQDESDFQRLATEVAALKTLDMYSTAEAHLYKSMLKMRSIASAPAFPSYIRATLNKMSRPNDAAHANVQARLLNSQPVKKALDDFISNVRTSLGANGWQNSKRKRIRKADYQQVSDKANMANGATSKLDRGVEGEASPRVELPTTEFHQGGTTDSGDSHKYAEFDSRLAASDEDSLNFDPEGTDDYSLSAEPGKTSAQGLSLSPSPITSESSNATNSAPQQNVRRSDKVTSDAKATTFLPSLMMGGYWSGSEMGGKDEDDNSEDQARKNRRGQRERRLIAEKKYGRNANHLKKQGPGRDRDQGWNTRRGAQADDGRGRRGKGRGNKARGAQASRSTKKGAASSSGANSDPVAPRKPAGRGKSTEGVLHPSWQAAKSAKEQKKAATFQGKKVTFD
ncbi:MAG: hypothetical protein Q9179_002852 [Wetmoreana sp. 5 TL-2023]